MSARPRAYICLCGHARSLHEDRQGSCAWASARSGVVGSRETCPCEMFAPEGQRPRVQRLVSEHDADPAALGERAELLGLGVLVTVFERLDPGERRRALAYLADRFSESAESKFRAFEVRTANQLSALRSARDEIMEHVENHAGGTGGITFDAGWLRTLLDGVGS